MRMIQMIPTIMQNAHDKEKLMDMFRAEAESNWDQFVGKLDNSGIYDFSIKLTVSLDSYLSPESGKKNILRNIQNHTKDFLVLLCQKNVRGCVLSF